MVPKALQGSSLAGLFYGLYHLHMRRTVWTLLIALLLQLVAGSAWAFRDSQHHAMATHCHDTVQSAGPSKPNTAANQTSQGAAQPDTHHCCAVGLGSDNTLQLPPLPQATPTSQQGPWASLSLRPDLRPPISNA